MSGPMHGASRFGTFVTVAVLLAAMFLMAIQGESAGNTANIAAAKATFRAKCSMCHGPDGAGSEVGKSMNIPDLRSSAIRKVPDSELAEVVANGKNGMPSFKGSLNAGQIHDLVAYVRTFAAKK
jgi:mono/diheme cytochrome c family protein